MPKGYKYSEEEKKAKYASRRGKLSKEVNEKRRQTCIERYGVDTVAKRTDVQNKRKQNSLEKHGVENYFQTQEFKEQRMQTSLEKHGVESYSQTQEAKDNAKQVCLEKHGVESYFQTSEFLEKRNSTCLDKYGAEHGAKSIEKAKLTNLEKYGVESYFQTSEFLEKRKKNWLIKYGVDNPNKLKEVQEKRKEKSKETNKHNFYSSLLTSDRLKDLVEPLFTLEEFNGVKRINTYNFKCKKCSNIFEDHLDEGHVPRCYVCFPYVISHYEDDICNWLKELGISNILRNDRQVISPLELDMYLPDYKLAIEFNGLHWHSELAGSKSKEYHISKTLECEKQGIQLVHIFEDEWVQKQEIVKSILLSKLGLITNRIYGRDTEIKLVPNDAAKAFLFDNHLQTLVNCKYYFGLYHEHALVYLIGISKPRFNKDYQYELVRSCPKIDTNVVGGFSKLIKHAVKALSISTMISYVDRRYFTGKGYTGNWVLLHTTEPNYYYIVNGGRESRVKYQKHKLQALFPDIYEDTFTEWEIMQTAGFDRIYDCGNLVFEYKEKV